MRPSRNAAQIYCTKTGSQLPGVNARVSEGTNRDTGEQALRSAAERGDVRMLENVLQGESRDERVLAARLLAGVGGRKADVLLLSVARDRRGQHPEVRITALESLGSRLGVERYSDVLEEFICGENRRVMSASRHMLQAADPEGYPRRLLSKGCLDHSAIKVYGKSGYGDAVPLLSDYIRARIEADDVTKTGNWGKVYAAVRALGNIGGSRAKETLEGLSRWLEQGGPHEGTLKDMRSGKLRGALDDALDDR